MKKIISILVLFFVSSFVFSIQAKAATFSGIAGTVQDGNTVTISGSGFGVKSSPEPFRSSLFSSNAAQNFQYTGSFNNSWYGVNGTNMITLQNDPARSADPQRKYARLEYSSNGLYGRPGYAAGISTKLPATGKLYFSWWDKFQTGFDISSLSTGGSPGFKWIYLGEGAHPHAVLSISQVINKFLVIVSGGIAGQLQTPLGGGFYAKPISFMVNHPITPGNWHFIELIYKINSAEGTQDGWVEFRVDNNLVYRADGIDIFDPGYANNPSFDMINFGGNYESASNTSQYRYYGDFYIDGSFSRVVLGDNSVYANCTHLETQIPKTWSDSSVSFTANQGSFSSGDQAYLFVVGENNVASAGYPITIGNSVTPPPTCTEAWSCASWSAWSTCTNSSQSHSRTCTDANSCGTTNTKPVTTETQSCVITYNLTNFTQLVTDWLKTKTSVADVNSDGKVNSQDLGIMMNNWGQ